MRTGINRLWNPKKDFTMDVKEVTVNFTTFYNVREQTYQYCSISNNRKNGR